MIYLKRSPHKNTNKTFTRFAYGVSKERLYCFLNILNQNRIRYRLRSKPIHVADINFKTGNIDFTGEYQQLWSIYIFKEDFPKTLSLTSHLERYSNEGEQLLVYEIKPDCFTENEEFSEIFLWLPQW